MPKFLELKEPESALDVLMDAIPETCLPTEIIPVRESLGRITGKDIFSSELSPSFSRSSVDGFAVIASDTFGASEAIPVYLKLLGEVPMGHQPGFELSPGETAIIHTGGMLPKNADANIMFEFTGTSRVGEVEILKAVSKGENVILMGEDVKPGDLIIASGRQIRPQEVGGMIAVGMKTIDVYKKPRIAILSSGDELVPPEISPRPGQVRDINSFTISALIEKSGGIPIQAGIMPDKIDEMRKMMQRAFVNNDMLIVTAGSSTSTRDFTAGLINELGSPGVLTHGINIKPGKPTIFAVCEGKPVIGLPGNPVSALVIAQLYITAVIEKISGKTKRKVFPQIDAILTTNISSQAGRTDYFPVRLSKKGSELAAEPIFFKSNLIFSLVHADGLACIPVDANGIPAGKKVRVILFD